MSTWIPDSDVSRVNREAGVRPVPVSAEVREVLKTARQMSEWTGGKFDVTFGALSGLWKFDHDQDNVIPDMREVRRRLPLIDYRAIQIDDVGGHGVPARAKGCRCTSAASAKAMRSIAARAFFATRHSRLHDPERRRHLRGRHEGWPPVAARHPGSSRPCESHVCRARSHGRDIQHIRRLRAVLS